MNCTKMFAIASVAAVGLTMALVSIAAEPSKDTKAPAGAPEMKLPPGWTQEDMQACAMAATPGKMHEQLAKSIGAWQGKCTMWMAPGMDPMKSECVTNNSAMLDGRFIKSETTGDMPGMGPFNALGVYGFDNVSQKFQSFWIDNCGTGMMTGTGELSSDGKTMTWTCTYNCPMQKKLVTMREVETITGPNTKTLEMYGPDPKTGKEYKMMVIEYTKKS